LIGRHVEPDERDLLPGSIPAVRFAQEQVHPPGVATVGPGDQVRPAIAIEVPELGTELAAASSPGDAGRRLDLVEPRRLGLLGFGVRTLVVVDEKSIRDAHKLIDSPITVEVRVM
jgi:hypothetical protein